MSRLYDTDFASWADETAQLLAKRRFEEIDLDALIEEVEGLAKGERGAYESHMKNTIVHLLKLQHAPPNEYLRDVSGWSESIDNARGEIETILSRSSSVAGKKEEEPQLLELVFFRALRQVKRSCEYFGLVEWPETCPWTIEQVLDYDFWPERQPSA